MLRLTGEYLPPFDEFPDEVAHRLRSLRRESSKRKPSARNHADEKDVWDLQNKGKFPEHLKGPLQRAGVAAFHHDLLCIPDKETTDSGYERFTEKAFVTALCSVLPYNRLTLGVSLNSRIVAYAPRNSFSNSATPNTGGGCRCARLKVCASGRSFSSPRFRS